MSQVKTESMTPIEYVVLKGWQYRKRGQWLDIKRCPFCFGGRNSDLHTFAIHSIDGNYVCKRGSCAVASNFATLVNSFGDKPSKVYKPNKDRHAAIYVKPKEKLFPPSEKIVQYLTEARKFSEDTIEKCEIKSDKDGNIVFTYIDTLTDEICLLKFRYPRKPEQSEKKAWREKGGKEVLWMLEKADPKLGPLVICFGEYDAMACVESGIPNATSVPSGDDSLGWITNDWEELEKYSDIVLWCDTDDSGQRAMGETARRLGIHRVRVVESTHKDANATLWYLLKEYETLEEVYDVMQDMVTSAPAYPFENLIRLVDVPDEQLVADGILSGIPELDAITGGFAGGGLTIWSGDNHAGKTTGVLGLCVIEPIQQRVPTFVYSGEMKKSKIKYWCELIAAGPKYLEERMSARTGRIYYEVHELARYSIRDWYSDMVHLYDKQGGTSEENLFDAMEFAYKKHGCKNFVLDNLMIMILSMNDVQSEYHRQAVFTKHCKQFADDFDVHVHLVAHGKKGGDPMMPPTKADIKGASEISNLADNAGAFWRVPESAKMNGLEGVDNMLCWFKTRDSGEQANIKLLFDKPSKRMTSISNPNTVERIYTWEDKLVQSNPIMNAAI